MKLNGPRVSQAHGETFFLWREDGIRRRLPIPAGFERYSPVFSKGQLEHLVLACFHGLQGNREASDYVRWMARRQLEAGADALDVSMDTECTDLSWRKEAAAWLVKVVQEVAGTTPLALGSLSADVLRACIPACDSSQSKPIVNALGPSHPDLLALVEEFDLPFVWFASSDSGMPHSPEERLDGIEEALNLLERRRIPTSRYFIDVLIYPKLAGATEGADALRAMHMARIRFGQDLRLIGGVSNFWFGKPLRKLVCLAFLDLMIQAGASAAVADPLICLPRLLAQIDREHPSYLRTVEMILSEQERDTELFIEDARAGRVVMPWNVE